MEEQTAGVDRPRGSVRAPVLVCGAGFAGLATAYWMHRLGFQVTVVEIAESLRTGGTPVDIKGRTVDVVRRMGLLDAIRARSLPPRRTEFMTADDLAQAVLPAQPANLDSPDEEHEIDRDDLLEILFGAVAADVDIVFGRSVVRLDEAADHVTARFADGARQDFALVFGCDGTRSNTRRLVFGEGDHVTHFLKHYAFLKVVPKTFIARDLTQIYSVPGRTVMLNGYEGKTDIALGFHCDHEIAYDHRDKAQQKRLVRERFEGLGWRTPELLAELDAEGDFYFDRICQIRMPAWSKGRVALVGDAGYCPSPFAGMGGSMAIVGAAALADAVRRHGDDVAAAFEDYDVSLRPFVEEVQAEAVSFGQAMFAPATDAEIDARNRMLAGMGA
ncbi:MAG: FAD-dependent monooxygenase [Janthinobacterium lividum]